MFWRHLSIIKLDNTCIQMQVGIKEALYSTAHFAQNSLNEIFAMVFRVYFCYTDEIINYQEIILF